jgi:hypothetical protein
MLRRVIDSIRTSAALQIESHKVRTDVQETCRVSAVLRRFSQVARQRRAEGDYGPSPQGIEKGRNLAR